MAHLNSIRILLSIVVIRSWQLHQLGIKNAFLRDDLQEVHMDQPPGFAIAGSEHLVCQLRKAQYGSKQSPHTWFDCFSARHSSIGTIVLIVYVDYILVSVLVLGFERPFQPTLPY